MVANEKGDTQSISYGQKKRLIERKNFILKKPFSTKCYSLVKVNLIWACACVKVNENQLFFVRKEIQKSLLAFKS